MKMQVIPKLKTRDKKSDRIVLSMTEKEAHSLMADLLKNKSITRASWSCILNLREYFDLRMILTAQAEKDRG